MCCHAAAIFLGDSQGHVVVHLSAVWREVVRDWNRVFPHGFKRDLEVTGVSNPEGLYDTIVHTIVYYMTVELF